MSVFRRLLGWATSFRARVALVVGVSFLPAMLAVVHDHFQQSERTSDEAVHAAESSVRLAVENIEGRLESARQLLIALSQSNILKSGKPRECEKILFQHLEKYPVYQNIGLADVNGDLIASARGGTSAMSVLDRPYFQKALEGRDFSVGDYQIARITGRPSLNCAYPVTDESGVVRRVVFLGFNLNYMTPLLAEEGGGDDRRLSLVDGQGITVGSSEVSAVGKPSLIKLRAEGKERRDRFQTRRLLCVAAPVRTQPPSGLRILLEVDKNDLFRPSRVRFFKKMSLLILALMMAAALAGRVGDYFISRDVDRLVETAGRLTAGELSARSGLANRRGELGDLGRAIDQMAESLQKRTIELQVSHESLERQVETRTRELADSNRQLESFSYSISHDLRAPLRAIDGFSQILLNEHAGSLLPEGRRLLDLVVKNTKHMAQLIDDLLAFSRLGRQDVVKTELRMDDLARDVYMGLTTPPLPGRAMDFTVSPMPHAWGDASMIRQVWTNLIDNALKFTSLQPRGEIEVGAESTPSGWAYYVKDNGVGFDSRYAHKLFQVFQRLHNTSDFSGTGVGLAIVQRVVQKHGGQVWAQSQPGKGARFWFTLPRGGHETE